MTMFQLTFRIALLLIILSMAATGLSRALPYNDDALRALLDAPVDCAAPCWSGIRPGVTPAQDAIALLKANPWVADIHALSEDEASTGRDAIIWSWKDAKPFPVDSGYGGVLGIEHGIVNDITLPTLVTLAETWLMLGLPSRGATIRGGYPYAEYDLDTIGYPARGLTLQLTIKRPITFSNYWGAPVTFVFQSTSLGGPFRLPCWTICRSAQP